MAFQPAVCNQCGGSLKVDDIDLNGFCKCEYCGVNHKIIDIITIDGLPTLKSFLDNAQIAMQDGKFEKSVEFFNEALKIKPKCHEAWWGLYLCNVAFNAYYGYEDKYGNSGALVKANIMENTINKYARHAIEYAPPSQKNDYEQRISEDLNIINNLRTPKKNKKGFIKKIFG